MSNVMRTSLSDFDVELQYGGAGEEWARDFMHSPTVEVKTSRFFLRPDSTYGRQMAYVEFSCRGRDGQWRDSGIRATKAGGWVIKFGDQPGGLLVETEWLRRAYRLAFDLGQFKQCNKEPNPTAGVLVGLDELWETRDR